ncbi:Bro-N domain-containing protein [Clostridium paraputrificum]|uniref:BRO-N domain-containing protein n=1 Tax=Clostridium paraputrificum TaxID=29363 RepID=UPI002FCD8B7A
MNNLTIINQQEVLGKDFKIYGTAENPLFLAKDVANWIEHSNVSMMLNKIDDEEKELIQIGTLNNAYSAWFLTEDGLYEILMQSRKPIAKAFKKEVKKLTNSKVNIIDFKKKMQVPYKM